MRQIITIILVFGLVVALSGQANAFDLQEEVQKLGEKNAQGYLGPMPTAFGMAMNSGLYHSANTHRFLPIPGFDIMIKFSLVQVSDEDLTYDFAVPDPLALDVQGMGLGFDELTIDPNLIYPDRETPTLFGDDSSVEILPTGRSNAITQALLAEGVDQNTIDFILPQLLPMVPDIALPTIPGTGIDMLALPMPQVSLGLPMHSEVTVRYIPPYNIKNYGEISLMGIGLKHEISQYIPLPGLFKPDISVQYMWQKFEVGDIISSTHTAMNIHASYGINLVILKVEPYVGFGIETSNLEVDYVVQGTDSVLDGTPVAFDLDGKNKSRITGGVKLGIIIPFVRLTADYSVGEYTAATIGIGINF